MKTVSMYTLSTCPWCRKAKKFFAGHNIPFTYIDYDLADDATQRSISQEMDDEGVTSFPFVRIDGEVIEGYQPERYLRVLGIRGDAE
jgi:glutaredoxin